MWEGDNYAVTHFPSHFTLPKVITRFVIKRTIRVANKISTYFNDFWKLSSDFFLKVFFSGFSAVTFSGTSRFLLLIEVNAWSPLLQYNNFQWLNCCHSSLFFCKCHPLILSEIIHQWLWHSLQNFGQASMSWIQFTLRNMKAECFVDMNLMHPGRYYEHLVEAW